MAIIETVTLSSFRDAFVRMGRKDQFSYGGLEILFDYLESLSDDIGENIELDVIALCCDFAESDYEELIQDYDINVSDCEDEKEQIDAVREYLKYNTTVVGEPFDGVFVYTQF